MTGAAIAAEQAQDAKVFQIFRGEAAPPLEMHEITGLTDVSKEGIRKVRETGAGGETGHDLRTVLEIPGFSLTSAWFKSGYPLPRHSHAEDCAYYVVGGTLTIGGETLKKGDGFFIPAHAPYSYTVGPEGVEVLEIRNQPCHDIKILANNPAFWNKAAQAAPENRRRWESEPRPSERPHR